MKGYITSYFLKLIRLSGLFKWRTDNIKVLIYEPNSLRRQSFKDAVAKQDKRNSKFDFKIVSMKISLNGYLSKADIVYCYGISRYYDLSHLSMLYVGIVGYNFNKENLRLPKIKIPDNYAAQYMADYLLASITAYERNLFSAHELKYKKQWDQGRFLNKKIRKSNELKIGIIGLGRVGNRVAEEFLNLGCEVYGYDLNPDRAVKLTRYFDDKNWEEMLNLVDYLIIAIPYTARNHHLIDEKILFSMHKDICIVNISRGKIIDENALIRALEKKLIRGAILDVFETEPLPKTSKLWRFKNVVVTPHIAGNIQLVFELIQKDFFNSLEEISDD